MGGTILNLSTFGTSGSGHGGGIGAGASGCGGGKAFEDDAVETGCTEFSTGLGGNDEGFPTGRGGNVEELRI